MAKQSEPQKMTKTEKMVDDLVQKAHQALDIMSEFDQKKVDYITHLMVEAGQDKHMELAIEAVKETGRGIVEDKAIKNMFATEEIWHNIRKDHTVGVIEDNKAD